MREARKEELESQIFEMTRGALVQVCIDPWTGRVVRRDEGIVLAVNKCASVNYSRDELRQIRDWLRRDLLIRVAPAAAGEAVIEPAEVPVQDSLAATKEPATRTPATAPTAQQAMAKSQETAAMAAMAEKDTSTSQTAPAEPAHNSAA